MCNNMVFDYALDKDEFELHGYFENKIVSKVRSNNNGIFKFSSKNQTLDINVPFELRNFWDKQYIKRVYGVTPEGIYIKLENLIRIHNTQYFHTRNSNYKYLINICVLSKAPFDNQFDKGMNIQFKLTDFDSWLPIFDNRDFKYLDDGGLNLKITKYPAVSLGIINIDGVICHSSINTVLSFPSPWEFKKHRKLNIKSEVNINISSYIPIEDNYAILIVKEFKKIFTIITNKRQRIVYLKPYNSKLTKDIFLNQYNQNEKNANPFCEDGDVFNYNSFKNQFIDVVNNFYNKSQNLKMMSDNYLMTLNNNLDLSNELIDLCQGIDSYFEAIPNVGFSLEKRLNAFVYSLPESLINILKENRNIILKEIIEKRKKGYLTSKDFKKDKKKELDYEDTLAVWCRALEIQEYF